MRPITTTIFKISTFTMHLWNIKIRTFRNTFVDFWAFTKTGWIAIIGVVPNRKEQWSRTRLIFTNFHLKNSSVNKRFDAFFKHFKTLHWDQIPHFTKIICVLFRFRFYSLNVTFWFTSRLVPVHFRSTFDLLPVHFWPELKAKSLVVPIRVMCW